MLSWKHPAGLMADFYERESMANQDKAVSGTDTRLALRLAMLGAAMAALFLQSSVKIIRQATTELRMERADAEASAGSAD